MTNPLKAKLTDLADGKLGISKLASKHACAMFADEAIGFLNRKHERPFFCDVPFDAPHDPHIVPDDFSVRYDADKLPLPSNILPQHPFNHGEMAIRDQATDLAGKPEHAARVKELLAILEPEQRRYGDKAPLSVEKPMPAEWTPPKKEK